MATNGRRFLIAIGLFVFCIALACMSGMFPSRATGGVSFDPASYDFGTLVSNQVYQYECHVRNNSNKEITIKRTKTSCGCTAVTTESDMIPVGGSTAVAVSINTKGRSGPFAGQVALQTDSQEYPVVVMEFTAEVRLEKGEIATAPTSIDFGRVLAGTTCRRLIVVVRSGDHPLNFVSASTETPGITVTRVAKNVLLTAKAPDSEELEVLQYLVRMKRSSSAQLL